MIAMCEHCFTTFREYEIERIDKGYTIACCNKCEGSVVDMDELILPTILELNKKGWNTSFCCSGHLEEDYVSAYIMFTSDKPPKAPKGFHYDSRNGSLYLNEECASNRLTGIEGFNELIRINRVLYRWAIKLPKNENKS